MTDTTALQSLADKVEVGGWWGDMPRPQCLHTDLCWKAFNGSLDAAKALHEAVLPGWKWGRQWSCHMWVEPCDLPGRSDRFYGEETAASNPARAWLLAIIRALIAKEGGRE